MKQYIKSIVVLLSICLVMSSLAAIVNHFTAPVINKAEADATDGAFAEVMPDGVGFDIFDFSSYKLPSTVTEVYKVKSGGYVFKLSTTGKSSGFLIMCGVNSEGEVTGCKVISHEETPGYADKVIPSYADKLKGTTAETVMGVDTVNGATLTSEAYRGAVKDALDAFDIIGGAEVDIRTEEEILAENLSNALPDGDKFNDVFVAEILDGVDTVYKAENGVGYVFVCGENFVGTDAQGKVTSDASGELKAKVEEAAQKLLASDSTELDLSSLEGIEKRIVSVKKTLTGNYIVRVEGAGYSIKGHYTSNTYIVIDISITPDGKIINCYTVSQDESKGYGAECEKYKFYSQFNGRDETNYGDIDAISGATVTTDGYKAAVKKALDTVKMLVKEGM